MYVQRLLQILTALLASLGALLLGMGQRSMFLPLCVMAAAGVSVWLTDIKGLFRLNRTVTNVAALGAGVVSLWQVAQYAGPIQVLGMANLLVYLQIILLFQRKEFRTYWQISVLSLAQVFVAAAFHHGFFFAVMLLVYLADGVAVLALLFLYRQRSQHLDALIDQRNEALAVDARSGRGRDDHLGARLGGWLDRWLGERLADRLDRAAGFLFGRDAVVLPPAPGLDAPTTVTDAPIPSDAVEASEHRWPLSGQCWQVASGAPARLTRRVVSGEFWRRLSWLSFGTVVVGVVLFFTVPRPGSGAWRGVGLSSTRTVGFSGRIRLGALGAVKEDPAEVLRLELFKADDSSDVDERQPLHPAGDLYLRGAVLIDYRDGIWRHDDLSKTGHDNHYRLVSHFPRPRKPPVIRQRITIEPLARDELFAIWPFTAPGEQVDADVLKYVRYDAYEERLLRRFEKTKQRFTYEIGTLGLIDEHQAEVVPNIQRETTQGLLTMPAERGAKDVPSLRALARQWLAETTLDVDDRYERAKYLERMLRDSERFAYSLSAQPRDVKLDPVEDFIANNPRGHCEYFATALCLMLRDQGVPARVVVGYQTDEWNDLGEFYQVRQLHAHAWVEAFLEPRHVPIHLRDDFETNDWLEGAWLRLDATPAAAEGPSGATTSMLKRVDSYLTWLDYIWDNYIMEMDAPRQRKAVYDPVTYYVKETYRRVTNRAWWSNLFAGVKAWLAGDGRHFYLRAGLVVSTFLLLLYALYRLARRLLRPLTNCIRVHRQAVAAGRARVAFFRRFETILAGNGLVRRPGQTHRELAQAAAVRLASVSTDDESLPISDETLDPLDELPDRIVDAYYEVRFGHVDLDTRRVRHIESALDRLETAAGTIQP